MTKARAYKIVGSRVSLHSAHVKAAVEGVLALAVEQTKKHGSFKVAGMIQLNLTCRPDKKDEDCIRFVVKAIPMKKFKKLVNMFK